MICHSFKDEDRVKLAKAVVKRLKSVIPDIMVDPSCESGFYIEANAEWQEKLRNDPYWKDYHGNARQLRFAFPSDGYINSLQFKDGVVSWSDEEVSILIKTINEEVVKL